MANRPPRVPHRGRKDAAALTQADAQGAPDLMPDDAVSASSAPSASGAGAAARGAGNAEQAGQTGRAGTEAEPATEAMPVVKPAGTRAAGPSASRSSASASASASAASPATSRSSRSAGASASSAASAAKAAQRSKAKAAASDTGPQNRRADAEAAASPRSLTAARQMAKRSADAVGESVRKAKEAVAAEIEADLAGENLPGGVRRKRKQDPQDRERRLIERTALEGAIRDPGSGPRPAPAAKPRATAPTPARALSTRVLALAIILIIATFMLFPAITTYVRQSAELRSAQELLAQEEAKRDALQTELDRWDDPDYVRQQARERIQRFLPGEKRYVVIGAPADAEEGTTAAVEPGEYRQGLPWGDGLWDSVLRASTPDS